MKAWCDQCGRYVDYDREVSREEELEIRGTRFTVEQTYGVCPVCGGDVLSNAQVDRNTHRAHNAYRLALGSITAEEIREILDMYNIGAQPLSQLLGWGDNTVERQMKHTIPDREHARRLRELKNPQVMIRLLNRNRGRIRDVAYRKALAAAEQCLQRELCSVAGAYLIALADQYRHSAEAWKPLPSRFLNRVQAFGEELKTTRRIHYTSDEQQRRDQYHLVFSGR